MRGVHYVLEVCLSFSKNNPRVKKVGYIKCVNNAFDVNDLESRGDESIEIKKIIPH